MSKPRRPSSKTLEKNRISEEMFERIEADPGYQRMMKKSEEEMRAGRFITHEELVNRIQARRIKRA